MYDDGVDTLVPYVAPKTVSRVILLSDGCANAGLVDPQAIWAQCVEFAGAGIGTSTYGLGSGFNEDLMIGMARSGHGTSYYGESAPGVKVTMFNDYGAASDHAWWLPDLAFGGEAWAIARFKVPKKLVDSSASDPVTLGTIALRYTGIDGEPRAIQPEACTLPALPASAFGAISDDELVLRLLRTAQKLGADNPWIAAVVVELRKLAEQRNEAMFSKASAYGSRRMQSRLAVRDESLDAGAVPPAAAYLRRKSNQGKGDNDATRSPPRR